MAGYCIGLFKYMRVDEDLGKKEKLMSQRKSTIQSSEKVTEHEKFLAYGEFDRIGFEKVVNFSRFRDISAKSKIWIGDRQTLLVSINEQITNIAQKLHKIKTPATE